MRVSSLVLLATAASAHVMEQRDANSCLIETVIIDLLKKSYAQSASTYCSSFLAKSTTTTVTTTPTSTITYTPLVTVYSTPIATSIVSITSSQSTTVATSTITTTISSGTTTLITCPNTTPAAKLRRDVGFTTNLIGKVLQHTFVKRAAASSSSTTAGLPQPLMGLQSSLVSTICGCVVTPVTSTSTVTKTASASTLTSTASTNSTVTNTAPTSTTTTSTVVATHTDDITSSTTSTVIVPTATVQSSPPGPAGLPTTCGCSFLGGGSCNCYYTEICGVQFVDGGSGSSTSTQPSYDACANTCDSNSNCFAFSFQKSTGSCVQLPYGGYNQVQDADWDSASLGLACGGICTQTY